MNNVICRNCKKSIDKSIAIAHPTKQRLYFCCEDCLAEYDSKAVVVNKDEQIPDPRRALTDYIQQQYYAQGITCNDDIDWGRIGAQLQQLNNEDYIDTGIQYTLYYYCEILGNNLPDSYFLKYIIHTNYKAAQNYFTQTEKLEQEHQLYQQANIQIIQTNQKTYENKRHKHFIDLSQYRRT